MFSNKHEFLAAYSNKIQFMHGSTVEEASDMEKYTALVGLLRDTISRQWTKTNQTYEQTGEKQVYYFSIEFLLGRLLTANLLNAGLLDTWQKWLTEFNINIRGLEQEEPEPGLGNGGLGRLAACFLDSLASLQLPGHGCGIRYKYGLFSQKIIDGAQVEHPDYWLKNGNEWEYRNAKKAVRVTFGGRIRSEIRDGRQLYYYDDAQTILAVPYDMPIIGYKNNTVNTLRLWSAETEESGFDLTSFNKGNYLKAVEQKYATESICEILYPEDDYYEGRVLRLKQQYFMVSAGVQSIVRRYKKKHSQDMKQLPEKVSIHINDTHPSLAIAELMRILMDEEGLQWEDAFEITRSTVAYTNHTILPEALEKWPVDIMQPLLPRIYMIIEEINRRFISELESRYPGDWNRINSMSIIHDNNVHMANLAVVGSYSVNGVAKIHTEILKRDVLKNFYTFYPQKFNNKTNGVTHRRWLMKSNPRLTELICKSMGTNWVSYPQFLSTLMRYQNDAAFLQELEQVKYQNKQDFAAWLKRESGVVVNPASIFDVHVKRIHAYKRQLMNALHILELYRALKANPNLEMAPRTFIFGGKAAPGYYLAKRIIKFINTLAEVINADKTIQDKIKVVYVENYCVSRAELIFPASDVSEQISTASKEASGTGNMKFMMNGAVAIGTMDGANVEIRGEVGDDNIVIFGLSAEEVLEYYQNGQYKPWDLVREDSRIRSLLDSLLDGSLGSHPEEFRAIYDSLVKQDEFFVLKDLPAYAEAQKKLDACYRDRTRWNQMCLANIAHSGKFSSDRTISEYAVGIWKINPVPVEE